MPGDSIISEGLDIVQEQYKEKLETHKKTVKDGKNAQSGADRCNHDYFVRMDLAQMIYVGVFERYPKLKVVEAEHEIAWLPYFIKRMDLNYKERHENIPYRFKGDTLPSDFMRNNVLHSFQEDDLGIQMRALIGVHTLMWGSDYPHAESTFP